LGDLLQLQPRVKVEKKVVEGLGPDLPPSISVHIVAEDFGEDGSADTAWGGDGPLVEINNSNFKSCKQRANQHFENAFVLEPEQWSYYYLYAFERYAFFRQQAEGDVGNRAMKSWYDDGYEMLSELQKSDGSLPGGPEATVTPDINTSFAIMFLVRSSEILSIPPAGSNLEGGSGLGKTSGKALKELKNGRVRAQETKKNLPALIYAMGDPDVRVCMEAHNGLRLVSRKIDSITVPEKPSLSDFQLAKERWVSWLLKLRPDAELLD